MAIWLTWVNQIATFCWWSHVSLSKMSTWVNKTAIPLTQVNGIAVEELQIDPSAHN